MHQEAYQLEDFLHYETVVRILSITHKLDGLPVHLVNGDQKSGNNREVKMATRTTHRSQSGTKLYAVRDKKGRFKDIQTYKRAHGQDIKPKSKKEK